MNLIAILFALAGAVWLIPLARSGRLILMAMAVLALGTVFGPSFFAVDGPIQISIDRLLFFAIVALALVGLRFGMTSMPQLNRVDWLVLGIVVWFGYSAATGGSDPPGTPPSARWLFYVAMPAAMYFIPRLITIKTDDVRWMLSGAILLGIYLAVTAVFETKGVHSLVFPRYIVDAENWEFFGRGRGPLMNPSGNGIVISIGLAAAAVGLIQASRERRLLYGVIIVCLLTGIYATLTRSAWLGGAATLGIIGLLNAPRRVRVFALGLVILVGGIATTSIKDKLFRLKRDQNLSAADAEKSIKLRPLLAIVAWEMFKDQPITGHGYGHYYAKRKPYHDDRGYQMPLDQARPYAQHNVFLSVLVDTGLVGLALFASWFLMIAAIAWQLARDGGADPVLRGVGMMVLGTLAAYFCNGTFQDTMIIPMVHMFLFFLAGVSVTVRQSGIEPSAAGRPRTACRAADTVVVAG